MDVLSKNINLQCDLCTSTGGRLIYKNELLRVVLVDDASYPGFVRLIINPHVKELTDLGFDDAQKIFTALFKLEHAVRTVYQPDKINIASLGNQTPHLHWHIIPRYTDDKHFPNSIWGDLTHPDYVPGIDSLAEERLIALIKSY